MKSEIWAHPSDQYADRYFDRIETGNVSYSLEGPRPGWGGQGCWQVSTRPPAPPLYPPPLAPCSTTNHPAACRSC